MATSHYCNGTWRDGPVAGCPRHRKLSKKLTKVYGGVGEPGGTSATKAPQSGGGEAGASDSQSSTAAYTSESASPAPASGSKES
jgi:hypothetical protein